MRYFYTREVHMKCTLVYVERNGGEIPLLEKVKSMNLIAYNLNKHYLYVYNIKTFYKFKYILQVFVQLYHM